MSHSIALVLTLLMPPPPIDSRPADPVPPQKPIPRIHPDNAGVWERIQDPLDRSTGYISPEPIFQLDQLERDRLERRAPFDPRTNFHRFQIERDRWLRIDERQLAADRSARRAADAKRDLEQRLRLREYELFIESGDLSSLIGQQAERDRMALQSARARRNEQLGAFRADDPARDRIEREYQLERSRILGFDPPATQPGR
jgi:hypothetical protein